MGAAEHHEAARNRTEGSPRTRLILVALGGLFTVRDPTFAQEWTQTTALITNWACVASSADGRKLVTVGEGIYTSTDSGGTWTSNNAPATSWSASRT